MTDWHGKGEPRDPTRKRGALVEQADPLSMDDLRVVYRRRVRETPIVDGRRVIGSEVTLLDRMLATIFWLVEKRELPTARTLTGKEWDG